jgi:hypothetical protein
VVRLSIPGAGMALAWGLSMVFIEC